MGYMITFMLGSWFGFAVAACLSAAKDRGDMEV